MFGKRIHHRCKTEFQTHPWYFTEQPFLESPLLKAFLYQNCRLCVYNVTARTLSQTISWEFSKIFQKFLFQTLDDCFKFQQKLLLCLCCPCPLSFKKFVCVISFAHAFWHRLMKNYVMIFKSQNFYFKIILSYEIRK